MVVVFCLLRHVMQMDGGPINCQFNCGETHKVVMLMNHIGLLNSCLDMTLYLIILFCMCLTFPSMHSIINL